MWVGYDVGCTMGLTLGHSAWQIDWPSNGSTWNSYSFQPVGQWMGYSFTELGAEGCCRSLNALLDGTIVVSDKMKICNMFSYFFTNIGINLAQNIPNATHDPSYYLRGSFVDNMYLSPVTENEVFSLIKSFKNSVAGWDDLAPKQIKIVSQYISRPLPYSSN